ncbi:238_t:CDS:2, partial [Funneliformis geosporum]
MCQESDYIQTIRKKSLKTGANYNCQQKQRRTRYGRVIPDYSESNSDSDDIINCDPISEEVRDGHKIKFDFTSISNELQCKPRNEWKVNEINITDRFRKYQMEVLKKAETEELEDIYEILSLSSIIVLRNTCPYPIFTNDEWNVIIGTNPYTIRESTLPPEISFSLRVASFNHFLAKDVFMKSGESKLGRTVAHSLIICRYDSIPNVVSPKMTEGEHCFAFLFPILRPFSSGEKEYKLALNRSNLGMERPDLSCTVNHIPILNSEIKPIGCTPLQRKKDYVKAQLKGRKSINQQLKEKGGPGEAVIFLNVGDLMESFVMDLSHDGIYSSWSFLTNRLVTDKTMIPLAEIEIHHVVPLEV